MSRPREFDEEEVLNRALDVFWDKGYDGTSVDDLVKATGLGRASLYGAFGDKEALYERVVRHYMSRSVDVDAVLACQGTVRAALEALLRAWLATTCSKNGRRGCFIQLAATVGEGTPFARGVQRASLARMERALTELIARGQESGELPARAKPTVLARLLVVLSQGIAASARAGWGQDRLSVVIDEALLHVTASG